MRHLMYKTFFFKIHQVYSEIFEKTMQLSIYSHKHVSIKYSKKNRFSDCLYMVEKTGIQNKYNNNKFKCLCLTARLEGPVNILICNFCQFKR